MGPSHSGSGCLRPRDTPGPDLEAPKGTLSGRGPGGFRGVREWRLRTTSNTTRRVSTRPPPATPTRHRHGPRPPGRVPGPGGTVRTTVRSLGGASSSATRPSSGVDRRLSPLHPDPDVRLPRFRVGVTPPSSSPDPTSLRPPGHPHPPPPTVPREWLTSNVYRSSRWNGVNCSWCSFVASPRVGICASLRTVGDMSVVGRPNFSCEDPVRSLPAPRTPWVGPGVGLLRSPGSRPSRVVASTLSGWVSVRGDGPPRDPAGGVSDAWTARVRGEATSSGGP